MTAGSVALRFAGAVLALAVAGCSGPPWVTAVSPDVVALRWYPHRIPELPASAAQVARAHCAAAGKTAVLASEEETPGALMAQYDCRATTIPASLALARAGAYGIGLGRPGKLRYDGPSLPEERTR